MVFVTFNSEKILKQAIAAADDNLKSIDGEIYIFDNNSGDGTVALVKTQFPDIKIHASSKNIGFARACNAAARELAGKYILFINPDCIIDNDTVGKLVDAFKTRPDAGAMVPRLRFPDGRFQPTCRHLPTPYNIVYSRRSAIHFKKGGTKYTLGDYDKITEVPAAAATCMLLEREFFLKLGGFDERFFMYMEDTDLCQRIAQAGRKIYFMPKAGGVHHWGEGAAVSKLTTGWYHHHSVWKYFLKHYPNGFSLFVLPLLLICNLLLGKTLDYFRKV